MLARAYQVSGRLEVDARARRSVSGFTGRRPARSRNAGYGSAVTRSDVPPVPTSAEDHLRRRVKVELRKRMRGLRNTLPESACAERSSRIVERLLALPQIESARSVALFWPMERRREVDLRQVDARLRQRGVRIAYPSVEPETQVMTFRFVTAPDAMEESGQHALSFREPDAGQPEAAPRDLDAIVVPALAVDPSGQRIGYGAGHYDRALPRFAPPATTIAVAFDFQLVAELPVTEGDVPVDYVVTDARSLRSVAVAGLR